MPSKYQNHRNGSFPIKYTSTQFNQRDDETFSEWYNSDNPYTAEAYLELLMMGWKFSTSWKEDSASTLVSATMVDEKHARYGYCVTSWADDPLEALFMTVFKLAVLYRDRPIPEQSDKPRRG